MHIYIQRRYSSKRLLQKIAQVVYLVVYVSARGCELVALVNRLCEYIRCERTRDMVKAATGALFAKLATTKQEY